MSGFDRLKPRSPELAGPTEVDQQHDAAGKRALFSAAAADATPATGSVLIECSGCNERSVLSPTQALRAALPSVHLPFVKRDYPSWMRCPACQRHRWVRAIVTL
ncbi:MAG: hypothetical protein QOK42_1391 [Frankiaceae bacterium]|nr:hypothetical protein [Frankiaceae bacterium]